MAQRELEDLRKLVEQLKAQNRQLEADMRQMEAECAEILMKWQFEKSRLEEENQRYKVIAQDRLVENERIASTQGSLLMRLALAYSEIERLSKSY